MLKTTIILIVAGAAFSAALVGFQPKSDPLALTAAIVEVPAPADPIPALTEDQLAQQEADHVWRKQHDHLSTYVLGIMQSWPHATAEMPVVHYELIANDIASAVMTRSSSRWPAKLASEEAKAILLASLGYWEGSRFAEYVDDLSCTRTSWRTDPTNTRLIHLGGNCDGGNAHSIWQIHPIYDESKSFYATCGVSIVDASRLDAARCALEIARRSLVDRGSLAGYSGEGADHPKADERLDWALKALREHPFQVR